MSKQQSKSAAHRLKYKRSNKGWLKRVRRDLNQQKEQRREGK